MTERFIGKTFGNYRIDAELRRGGMGIVFRAHHKELSGPVAVKIVHPRFIDVDEQIKAFVEEAKTLSQLEHDHILKVHDLGRQDVNGEMHVYMAMYFAAGGSLSERLQTERFAPEAAAQVIDALCSALDYAHKNGVLHLDIKPANILFTHDGRPLLADFGIAKMLEDTSHAKADTGAGTKRYMPPEQSLGGDVRRTADVFALGITLYEMLTGAVPKRSNKGAPLLQPVDAVPKEVFSVIEKATQVDPQDRYATAGQLARAFRTAIAPTPPLLKYTAAPVATDEEAPLVVSQTPPRFPIAELSDTAPQIATIREVLRDLGEFCEQNAKIIEREAVNYTFKPGGLFEALGYDQERRDVLVEHEHADVVLRTSSGRVLAVFEFKRPSANPSLGLHQLQDEYLRKLLPDVGVLTNGRELVIYRREGLQLQLPPLARITLRNATTRDAQNVYNWLGQRSIDFTDLRAFDKALANLSAAPLPVRGPNETGGISFLDRLSLHGTTQRTKPFGRLVVALYEALPLMLKYSRFTQGAYAFWRRIYARDLKNSDAPRTWRVLMESNGRGGDTLYHFMFALESAYAVLSRLLLARAMENHAFPNLSLRETLIGSLRRHQTRGRLPAVAYAVALKDVFDYAGRQAFQSIFASDIFDWWYEIEQSPESAPVGECLADIILALFEFDFKPMTGDLLGSLYQSYFDPETRKALGEFYTPPEVVDFMLDQIGYTADQAIEQTRLLDPSCGSGTFLVHALQRYLKAVEERPPAAVLRNLLGGLRIVGFDVNPFAVLMAQANYAAQIIPLYARALNQTDLPPTLSIPVLRTDSLRQEYREGDKDYDGQLTLQLDQDEDTTVIKAELPVKMKDGNFFETHIPVPRFDKARLNGWVNNADEYFRALRVLFDAVADERIATTALRERLRIAELQEDHELANYLAPAAAKLVEQRQLLRDTYNDGRFLKTMADLALSLVLKSDIQYHFVVGNPPYIRIQHIPEIFRKRWEIWYQWAKGNFDAYVPFIERSIFVEPHTIGPNLREWLLPGGRLSFICSNRFLLANYAETLREKLPQKAAVELIFDFRDSRVFKDALNYPAILMTRRLHEDETTPATVPTIRVFDDPRQGATQLLDEAQVLLAQLAEGATYAQGAIADAFPTQTTDLRAAGWLLMPPEEHTVFAKIEEAATVVKPGGYALFDPFPKISQSSKPYTMRLEDLTSTQSGAFQGIATGDDASLIFRLLEDRGETLLVQPKGVDDATWQGPKEIEIERAVLRPWLFGRDVERWSINWDRWYVFFPYAIIDAFEKRGGTEVLVSRYRLIPNSEAVELFKQKYSYTGDFPIFDFLYPKAWQYVCQSFIENRLRNREHGKRFRHDKRESLIWYGLGRPQNLELFNSAKLLMQISSPTPDFAFDEHQNFILQHGGRGGGTDGIVVKPIINNWLLLALLNSNPVDFFLKHISVIFGGKTYSYSDAFIKQLPIKLPLNDGEQAQAQAIADIARELTQIKSELRAKEREREAFPTPQARALPSLPDLYPLSAFLRGLPQGQSLKRNNVKLGQQTLDGGLAMEFGRTTLTVPHQEMAEVIQAWLRVQSRATLRTDDLLGIRIPGDPANCRRLVEMLKALEQAIGKLSAQLNDGEQKLNTTVAEYYVLSEADQQVINAFLARF